MNKTTAKGEFDEYVPSLVEASGGLAPSHLSSKFSSGKNAEHHKTICFCSLGWLKEGLSNSQGNLQIVIVWVK